ncbi:MAG: hypothetical protein OES69_16790 [Myxococcales bacterium]|nr:hypothetical protein [Myxococcales bacterium]
MLAVVASLLVWNAGRLEAVESDLAAKEEELASLESEKRRQEDTLVALKDAPDGGVRAVAQKLNTTPQLYDFFLWVDVSDLSKTVSEVRYQFENVRYKAITSSLAENGFAAFHRGPSCPGKTQVTITFEDGATKSIDYDLCAVVGVTDTR